MHRGDFGDFTQAISQLSATTSAPRPSSLRTRFYTNQGFSSYNGLLCRLQKNLSHGLQFDVNYTFAHSIDNSSFFANSEGDTGIGGIGLVCDALPTASCRANSDFDVTNYITADVLYQLPFGKAQRSSWRALRSG